MQIYNQPPPSQWPALLKRPLINAPDLEATVGQLLQDVAQRGDTALRELTLRFDKVQLDALAVSSEEITEGARQVEPELQAAIQLAHDNIARFHEAQRQESIRIQTMPGVACWQKSVAIEKVGLYIPGGTAPLFSTVLMVGVPARIAGCQELVLCTPPQADGSINPVILYTAQLLGIDKIYKLGGAQAVAAMAYGTETVPAVNKIFGPGNQYVTTAKQIVSRGGVAIDMPAGPSEVLVLAGENANPDFIAADLLSQAEHGVDSQVVLLAFSAALAEQTLLAIERQLESLERAEMARVALQNSPAIVVQDRAAALHLINEYGPEHLILAMDDAEQFAEGIRNAGSVFLGHYTPESVGDYASGTNHVLPTNGYAKAYSGLNLDAFVKKITFQQLSPQGLRNIGPAVERMAEAEQLTAHRNAVSVRLKTL
ncbi:MAG: histidinol dehydrogenase [Bacteroidota bacterium]